MPATLASAALKVPLFPEELAAEPTTVCVTGATGFLGAAIVERLLAAGHTVHATTRDPAQPKLVTHLMGLPGADKRLKLKLFKAELRHCGTFNAAIAGCTHVVHCANPMSYGIQHRDAYQRLIYPSAWGVTNVLGSCNSTFSVKRVVLTSTVFAAHSTPAEHGAGHTVTEQDWAQGSRKSGFPYSVAKALSEKKAWEMAKAQDRWDLVVVCPGHVFGPPLAARSGGGCALDLVTRYHRGEMQLLPGMQLAWSDVRDVAAAHCLSLFKPTAKGRYFAVSGVVPMRDVLCTLASVMAEQDIQCPPVPTRQAPTWLLTLLAKLAGEANSRDSFWAAMGAAAKYDTTKLQELGFKDAITFRAMLSDTVARMHAIGMLPAVEPAAIAAATT